MNKTEILLGNLQIGEATEFILSIAPDWPMIILTAIVGFTSFWTSRALVKVTRQNQTAISQSKQAEIRLAWQKELRNSLAEMSASCLVVNTKANSKPEYESSNEYFNDWQKILILNSKVNLLLTSESEDVKALKSLVDDMVFTAISTKGADKDFTSYLVAMEDMAKVVLENEWSRIKRNLGK